MKLTLSRAAHMQLHSHPPSTLSRARPIESLSVLVSCPFPPQIDAVYNFVCDNVKRLLGADTVSCFPVSSRLALSSKTRAPDSDPVTSWKVLASPPWQAAPGP